MSNRWRVVREGFPSWCPGEHWWQVQELNDDGYWYADPDGMFSHFAPALAYADHRARTITVTLPRPQGKKRIECTTHPSPYQVYAQGVNGYGGVGTVTSPYGHIYFCDAGDMEAVALYLLTLARKGGNDGA